MFGGFNLEMRRMDTVYIIDLITMVLIILSKSLYNNCRYSLSSRPGVISVSQKVDLGQRGGLTMQHVVSTIASGTLNYWLLEDGTDRTNH